EQVFEVHANFFGPGRIERMLGIDERGDPPFALNLRHGMQRHSRFAARFGAENLDDSSPWKTAATKGDIETQGARADSLHFLNGVAAELHNGALAKLLLDLLQGVAQFLVLGVFSHDILVN